MSCKLLFTGWMSTTRYLSGGISRIHAFPTRVRESLVKSEIISMSDYHVGTSLLLVDRLPEVEMSKWSISTNDFKHEWDQGENYYYIIKQLDDTEFIEIDHILINKALQS